MLVVVTFMKRPMLFVRFTPYTSSFGFICSPNLQHKDELWVDKEKYGHVLGKETGHKSLPDWECGLIHMV
jgi:hypothetical protein